ncbi:MAG: hypothetical protein AAGF87_05505, partial [Bacteroidota bacterium]
VMFNNLFALILVLFSVSLVALSCNNEDDNLTEQNEAALLLTNNFTYSVGGVERSDNDGSVFVIVAGDNLGINLQNEYGDIQIKIPCFNGLGSYSFGRASGDFGPENEVIFVYKEVSILDEHSNITRLIDYGEGVLNITQYTPGQSIYGEFQFSLKHKDLVGESVFISSGAFHSSSLNNELNVTAPGSYIYWTAEVDGVGFCPLYVNGFADFDDEIAIGGIDYKDGFSMTLSLPEYLPAGSYEFDSTSTDISAGLSRFYHPDFNLPDELYLLSDGEISIVSNQDRVISGIYSFRTKDGPSITNGRFRYRY